MNIKENIANKIKAEIAELQEQLAKVEALTLGDIDDSIEPSLYRKQVDFDRLSHANVIKVIQAIPGKWDKSIHSDGNCINYETTAGGLRFRCYAGEPPPNCKIVEVLETVPARPETVRTVRRLQCV